MMHASSFTTEPVTFNREVDVILIPDGFELTIPEGTSGIVTQVLGGNFTVQVESGYLVRVAGKDAEAIGRSADEVAFELDASAPLEEQIWSVLGTIFDPEIPVNIVELGLIYGVTVPEGDDADAEGAEVSIKMTLTAPGCGMGQILKDDVEYKVSSLDGVRRADVDLVFDPPWNPTMMSDAARLELGMDY